MSGSTVQRGEFACFNKWTRAKSALLSGVDLVVELPTVNVLSSAKRFAQSSVHLLHKLGVDAISFGSELGEIALLKEVAQISLKVEKSDKVTAHMSSGLTYPQALTLVIEQDYGTEYATTLANPNNLLGIEYIKAVSEYCPQMELFTVKREQAQHDSMTAGESISSASYIRSNLDIREQFIPDTAKELYNLDLAEKTAPILLSTIERGVLLKLRQMSSGDFLKIADVSNGLENRLVKSAQTATSLEEFYSNAKSKSIIHARIRRIVMNALLEIDNELTCTLPQYGRVLGMNTRGKEVLKLSKKSEFVVSPKFATLYKKATPIQKKLLDVDIKATDISMLACENIQPIGLDFTKNTVIV